MKLNDSQYKQAIGKHFDYTMEWDFLDVVANILERIDFDADDIDDEVWRAVDDELIYCADQWTVMKFYQSPREANFDIAFDYLLTDIRELVDEIKRAD